MFAHEINQKIGLCLKDCRLIPNPANDGDSFHVSVGDEGIPVSSLSR